MAQPPKKPVVVYGASGYTGMLIIEQLIDLHQLRLPLGPRASNIVHRLTFQK